MGSSNSSKQSQQSQTSYDPQLKSTFLGNYASAQQVAANNPVQAYSGPLSADFSGTALPGAIAQAAAAGAPTSAASIASYYNPHESDVVNASLADLEHQRLVSDQQTKGEATMAGAWGGDGASVLRGLNNDSYARQAASTSANLREKGYTDALGAAQADQGRALQAATVQGGFGQAQQQQQQSAIQAAYQEWLRQKNYPLQIQQMLNQAAGILPSGATGTSSGTGSSSGFTFGPSSVSV